MGVVADFSIVIAADTHLTEATDDAQMFQFNTGSRREGSGAVCVIDYSWDATGADRANILINDQRIGVLRVREPHATRVIAFDARILSGADSPTANRLRFDVDSPTPGRQLTVHSAVVFYHQAVG